MSVWDKFFRLDKLDIGFYENALAKRATIYGNDKNQVEIYVKVKIVDMTNKPLNIPDDELIKNIYFVRYLDGSKEINSFNVTDKKSDYVKVVKWDTQVMDTKVETHVGEKIIKYYVSALEDKSIDLSVGIHIPSVGDFNTSEVGTATRNGPRGEIGSIFVYPKLVHINAIPAIDYGLSDNIRIEMESLKYSNNFKWETRIDVTNNFTYQDNGEVWRRAVKFFPAEKTGQNTFKDWTVYSGPSNQLKDGMINLGRVNWKEWSYDGYRSGIDWNKNFPSAVVHGIKKGNNQNQTHVNIWFGPSYLDEYQLDGNFVLKDEGRTYLAFPKTMLMNNGDHNETATVYTYKFIIPDLAESKEYNWVSVAKSPEFTVTDHFGNTGKFTLIINDGEYFDKPGIEPVR